MSAGKLKNEPIHIFSFYCCPTVCFRGKAITFMCFQTRLIENRSVVHECTTVAKWFMYGINYVSCENLLNKGKKFSGKTRNSSVKEFSNRTGTLPHVQLGLFHSKDSLHFFRSVIFHICFLNTNGLCRHSTSVPLLFLCNIVYGFPSG